MVFAVKRFHQYLYGHPFTIFTDHKPLTGLFSESKGIPSMASARVQRWALTLSAYQYKIVYRAGSENANADAFSRLPLADTPSDPSLPPETVFLLDRLSQSPVTVKQIQMWTDRDPVLAQVKRWVMLGWPVSVEQEMFKPYMRRQLELSVQDGVLLWGSRVIIPPPGQARVMEELHDAHPGVSRMKGLARSFVWWPGMDVAIEGKVKTCSQCQINQKMPAPAPLHPWEWPDRPWSRLHLDFAGPFMGRMFLVLVDSHSKWLDAHIMPNITAPLTTETLRTVFATHSLPDTVVTDNGPTFTGEVFQEFMQRNGIRHVRTAPYHPASNGLAERAVETLKDGLKKMTGVSLETKLSRFSFQYRITPHSTTGVSPAELLLGRRPKSHLDLLRPDVGARVRQSQARQKIRRAQRARDRVCKPHDKVFARNFGMGPTWLPGVVCRQTGPVSFLVDLLDGRQVRRHQDHLRVRCEREGVDPPNFMPYGGLDASVDSAEVPSREGCAASAAGQALPTEELRRSKRLHKPPDRLNL